MGGLGGENHQTVMQFLQVNVELLLSIINRPKSMMRPLRFGDVYLISVVLILMTIHEQEIVIFSLLNDINDGWLRGGLHQPVILCSFS